MIVRRAQVARAVAQPAAPDEHDEREGGERCAAVDRDGPRHPAAVARGVGPDEEGAEGQRGEGRRAPRRARSCGCAAPRDRLEGDERAAGDGQREAAARRPAPGRSPPATPKATGTTAASDAIGATTLIGPMARLRYKAAKPTISASPAPAAIATASGGGAGWPASARSASRSSRPAPWERTSSVSTGRRRATRPARKSEPPHAMLAPSASPRATMPSGRDPPGTPFSGEERSARAHGQDAFAHRREARRPARARPSRERCARAATPPASGPAGSRRGRRPGPATRCRGAGARPRRPPRRPAARWVIGSSSTAR